MTNLEELTGGENDVSGGLLWKKEWWPCMTGDVIVVNKSGGAFEAGAIYRFTASLELELKSSNATYTIIKGEQPGQKSYCKDGWNFCSEDECR